MIGIYSPDFDGREQWTVWTEPDGGKFEGRCIGVGKTRGEALVQASQDLIADWCSVMTELAKGE